MSERHTCLCVAENSRFSPAGLPYSEGAGSPGLLTGLLPSRSGADPFPRLLRRLRIPEDAPEAPLAEGVWRAALALARPASFRLPMAAPLFRERFGPHAAQSPHLLSRLEGCHEAWLLAATIGPALEERVQALFASGRAFEGYLMDVFGTWLVDRAMRDAIASLRARPGTLTRRLMPGTHGFAIEAQAVFVELAGEKLGLSLTAGWQLNPQKSVTAVIGRRP